MKLYYMPGACSLGIHVLLEEIGKPLRRAQGRRRQAGGEYGPEFVALNPKSKVPTLVRDGGSVLTEFPAIAVWLARKNPEKGLLPADADGEAQALEAMDYAVSTMHMQGFSRMFRPVNSAPTEADHDKVKARGKEIMEKGLAVMDKALEEQGIPRRLVLRGRRCSLLRFVLGSGPHEDAAAQERRSPLRAHEGPSGREARARAGRPLGRGLISSRDNRTAARLRGGPTAVFDAVPR